jgi:serine/threonine protein kinase
MNRMVPDDFEFERTLGIGAFSKVLVARYIPDGKRYAVKIIAKRQILNAPSEEEKNRLAEVARREMRMLLMCDHPSIVRFHASMQTSDDLMYVTELCEGGELLDAIKRKGTIPLKAARQIAAELISAIGYLHHAEKRTVPVVPNAPLKSVTILHRDIKPENIMLNEGKHVKLIDFGTAVILEGGALGTSEKANEATSSGSGGRGRAQTFCGTTHYMSPELLKDSFTCVQSDYWAFGCVLYHMLTGKRPFDAPTQYLLIKAILEQDVSFANAYVDANARDLIEKLLVKDPLQRPTVEEIKSHPFFSSITTWDRLHEVNVSELWQRDASWAKDASVARCKQCNKEFGLLTRKHHCRNCGSIFCHECSSRNCFIPDSTYTTQERVCDGCFARLHQQ